MSAAAEVQTGAALLNGIPGAITLSINSSTVGMNAESMNFTDNFKMEEIPAQDAVTIETVIASQRSRDIEFSFAPKSTTRALALAECAKIVALTPLQVCTIASDTLTGLNGTYNYIGGATVQRTRNGVAVCGIKMRQYEVAATAGTFAALAVVSG